MPSSTSSSDSRLPSGRWGRTWLLAAVLWLGALGLWEGTLRVLGFGPLVADDGRAWTVARRSLDPDSVTFLGTSRIQTALDPQAWARSWDSHVPVQLAVAGGSPLPVLEHLAADPSFAGLAVVEILPRILFDASGETESESERMLEAYRSALESPAVLWESSLQVALGSVLVFRSLPTARLYTLAFRRDPPRVPYYSMDRNRFLRLDFEKVDVTARERTLLENISVHGRPASEEEIERIVDRTLEATSKVRARGGEVVLLQMPRRERIRRTEERRYPSDRYWGALLARSEAPTLDCDLDPAFSIFECPDGSHIDASDTAAFTSLLARRVREVVGLSPRNPGS